MFTQSHVGSLQHESGNRWILVCPVTGRSYRIQIVRGRATRTLICFPQIQKLCARQKLMFCLAVCPRGFFRISLLSEFRCLQSRTRKRSNRNFHALPVVQTCGITSCSGMCCSAASLSKESWLYGPSKPPAPWLLCSPAHMCTNTAHTYLSLSARRCFFFPQEKFTRERDNHWSLHSTCFKISSCLLCFRAAQAACPPKSWDLPPPPPRVGPQPGLDSNSGFVRAPSREPSHRAVSLTWSWFRWGNNPVYSVCVYHLTPPQQAKAQTQNLNQIVSATQTTQNWKGGTSKLPNLSTVHR